MKLSRSAIGSVVAASRPQVKLWIVAIPRNAQDLRTGGMFPEPLVSNCKSALRSTSQGLPPVNVAAADTFFVARIPARACRDERSVASAYGALRNGSDSLCSLNDSNLRVAHARSDFQRRHRGQSIDRRQIRQAPALPTRRCRRLYLQRFPTSRLGPQSVWCRSARSGHSE